MRRDGETERRTERALKPGRHVVGLLLDLDLLALLAAPSRPEHAHELALEVAREQLGRAAERVDEARRELEPLVERLVVALEDALVELLQARKGDLELGVAVVLDVLAPDAGRLALLARQVLAAALAVGVDLDLLRVVAFCLTTRDDCGRRSVSLARVEEAAEERDGAHPP